MTDEDLIRKRLAFVETCVRELRTLADADALETDVRERRFVEHTLQIAVQACQDVASHVVSDQRLGEPRTNQELFDLLASAGWIDAELATALRRSVGFRNVLVHGYTAVDVAIVRYRGEIERWDEVGGPPMRLVLYGRENNSGTYAYFREEVLGELDFAPEAQSLSATSAVIHAVSQHFRGISGGIDRMPA